MSAHTNRQSSGMLAALASCMALIMTAFALILPLYARRFDSFGAGVAALGESAMAYALAAAAAAPLTGMLADRFGRRPIILLSLATYVVAFGGFLFASTSWQLIVLRGLVGVASAGLLPAIASTAGDLAPENRRAQWMGIVNGGAAAGWIAGPLLGGVLYDGFGYVVPFAASVAMAVGALLLAVCLIRETRAPAAQAGRPRPAWTRALPALAARPAFFLLMLISLGVMFAWAFIEPPFMFYAYDDLGWSSKRLGLAMSAYGVSFMLGEFALGRLSDRLGRKPVLVLGLALFSAQFAGLVLFRDPAWITVSFVLAGLGNALYDPALSALVLDIAPPEQTAAMMGLRSMAGSIGSALGPALVVLVTPFAGPRAVFLMATGLVLVLALASGLALRGPARAQAAPQLAEAAARR